MRIRLDNGPVTDIPVANPPKPGKHKFEKGKAKGRPKGALNKTTSLLKDAILAAGKQAGELKLNEAVQEARRMWRRAMRDGMKNEPTLHERYLALRRYRDSGPDGMTEYLCWLALNEPKSYAALLGRVLPYNLTAKVDHTHREYHSKEEILERLKESGVPIHSLQN